MSRRVAIFLNVPPRILEEDDDIKWKAIVYLCQDDLGTIVT